MIKQIFLKTNKGIEFIDITKQLSLLVKNIKEGQIVVFSFHTTATLWINENEKGLLEDIKKKLEKFSSINDYYEHDNFKKRKCSKNERRNGHSHLKTLLFQNPLIIIIKNGKMLLGEYQSVFFIEFDGPKKRKLIIQITKIN